MSQPDDRECWLLASLVEADVPGRLPGLLSCLGSVRHVECGIAGVLRPRLAELGLPPLARDDDQPVIAVAFVASGLASVLAMLLQGGCSEFQRYS